MLGRIVNRESVPKVGAGNLPIVIGKRLPAVDVQVVHDQVIRLRRWVVESQLGQDLGEFGGAAVRCRPGGGPVRVAFRLP